MVDFLKKINGTHLGILVISLFFTAQLCYAGPTDDNHIHVEQVNGGDNFDLSIDQLGYGNMVVQ